MKLALAAVVAAVLAAAGTTCWFSGRIRSMPESRFAAIHSIADVRKMETTFSPDALRSDITLDFLTETMDHYTHNRQILLVQPTDEVSMLHDQLVQKVQVKKVYEGDQTLSGTEIPVCYHFFHVQTHEEMTMAKKKPSEEPNVYHSSLMNYMNPESEYLVFLNKYTFLDEVRYTAPHPNVPWNFPLNDPREPVIITSDPVCSYADVSDAEIFVADQDGAENWECLKQQMLDRYC